MGVWVGSEWVALAFVSPVKRRDVTQMGPNDTRTGPENLESVHLHKPLFPPHFRSKKSEDGDARGLSRAGADSDLWVPDQLTPSWVCLPNDQPVLTIIKPGESALCVLETICKVTVPAGSRPPSVSSSSDFSGMKNGSLQRRRRYLFAGSLSGSHQALPAAQIPHGKPSENVHPQAG